MTIEKGGFRMETSLATLGLGVALILATVFLLFE
jgi:hypothetical protein